MKEQWQIQGFLNGDFGQFFKKRELYVSDVIADIAHYILTMEIRKYHDVTF